MKKLLDQSWQNKLALLPEDGMGWQFVDLIFADGGMLPDVVVVNGREYEIPDTDAGREIKDVRVGDLACGELPEQTPQMFPIKRRKKLDDDIRSLPKPVFVETLMAPERKASGLGQDLTRVPAKPNDEVWGLMIKEDIKDTHPGLWMPGGEIIIDGHFGAVVESTPFVEVDFSMIDEDGNLDVQGKAWFAYDDGRDQWDLEEWEMNAMPGKTFFGDEDEQLALKRFNARLNNLIGSLTVRGYTMKEIMDDVDSGSESRSHRCGSSLKKFDKKTGVATFSSTCLDGPHHQEITFIDWSDIVELSAGDEETDLDKLEGTAIFTDPVVGDLLKSSDITVYCDCLAYRFFYAFIAFSMGYGKLGEAWDSAPTQTNPNYSGTVCKHLISVYDHYFK